ncbi:MAG TPA: phosphatidate cytidylyltransferase [Desulfitobacteriaceae bacterium]|nr:phosphatidate cytidylyltransferase [Desulfitobacteriaceae bacterium]
MLKRIISALIWASLLLGLSYFGGIYTVLLVSILTILALLEYLKIIEHLGIKVWHVTVITFALFWLFNIFYGSKEWIMPILILWLIIVFGRLALRYPQVSLEEASYNLLAIIYPVGFFSYLFLLRQLPQGLTWTFLTFFLIWATDVFAYLIGKGIGKHPLAPKISPHKTIEGAIGGLCGSIVVGLVFWYWIGGVSLAHVFVLSLITGCIGQIGDLFESSLKRSAGIKDSGSLIPGHGGILDRCDSLIFILPLIYYYIVIFA